MFNIVVPLFKKKASYKQKDGTTPSNINYSSNKFCASANNLTKSSLPATCAVSFSNSSFLVTSSASNFSILFFKASASFDNF